MKLSIIVPTYNVEKYIDNCIKSLLNQRLESNEYEILIVNDGSTDRSGEIVNSYKEKYKNIRVINVENGGLSRARNIGIENAQGEYLLFVDSDDYISRNSLDKVLKLSIKNNLDMMFFNISHVVDDKKINCEYEDYSKFIIKDGINHFADNNVDNSACGYLISKKFIESNKLKFIEGRFCEDGMFLISAIFEAKRVAHVDVDIYRYVKRSNSITTKKDKYHLIKTIEDFVFAIEYLNKYYIRALNENYSEKFLNKLESRRNSYIFFMQIRMIRAKVGYNYALQIINRLQKINCYKYKRMRKEDYPKLKVSFIWRVLNSKVAFCLLCNGK